MSGNILDVLSKPAAADPDFYSKGLQNLNALRDTQAKQAIADITQQATDQQTGQVDPAKFNLLISQNPKAAWAGLAAMQAQGTAQSQQGVGQQEQVAGHRARLSQMYGIMAPLAAKGGPISLNDIQNAANQAHLSPTEAAQIGQDVNAEGGGDPNHDYSGWLHGRMTSNLTSQEQIARTTPNYQFHNIGGRLVPVDMNANTNPNPGSLITTLSPGEAAQIVRVDMGDGTTQQMPLSDAVTKLSTNPAMRILGPTTGGGGGGGGGGAPALNAAGDSATRKAAEGGPPTPNTPAAAVAQRTHDFWISQGYNEAQVAGILAGGPGSESDFTPTASGDGGTSYGLYQHHGPRLAAMQKYFNLPAGQMPTEQQQNQYAAWEISPQGPKAAVGAALKAAQTPAEAATIWTRDFGVPKDKSEIPRRAAGAQRFMGIYGQPQGPASAGPGGPPARPAGPPGVQMGGTPPPPPGGAAGPYTGGGIGAALAPGGGANPVVVRGTPIPSGKMSGDVGAMVQGMQLARANPLQQGSGSMVAGPGAPTGNNPLVSSVELPPQPGWGSAVGTYSGGPGPAAAPPARPAIPATPVVAAPTPVQPPATTPPAPTIGRSLAPGVAEAQKEASLGSAQDQVAFRRDLPSAQGRIFTAQQALEALKGAKTGGGTGWLQSINAILSSYDPGIFKALTGGSYDPAELATNRDLAEKYLTQIAMGNASRIGPGTDAKLAAAFTGNPNTHITNLAATDVLKVQIGLDRMQQAMGDDMQRQNVAPQDFASWRQNWARTHDPRAFVLDSMSPEQLASLKETMKSASPQEKSIFRKSVEEAHSAGHVNMMLPGQ